MEIELCSYSILTLFKPIAVDQIPLLLWVSLGLISCLVLTSICAASENSLFSHRESDVQELREEDSATSKRLLYMLARPKTLLAAILAVNSFGVVAFLLLSNVLIDSDYHTSTYLSKKGRKNSLVMVFLFQKKLDPTNRIRKELKKIYGINSFLANQICDQLGFHMNLTVGELSVDQTEKLGRILQYYYLTENDLKKQIQGNFQRFIQIGCYKGFRVTQHLPLRGQRTHTNAKTAKRILRA